MCGICADEMGNYNPVSWIMPKCCLRAYVHLLCMRKAALTSGYDLKCVYCKNKQFHEEIKYLNVYVPDRIALWENDTDFYDFKKKKTKSCNHTKCICPKGKEFKAENGVWAIVSCQICSTPGFHKGCIQNFKEDFTTCDVCKNDINCNDAGLDSYATLNIPTQSQDCMPSCSSKTKVTGEEIEDSKRGYLEFSKTKEIDNDDVDVAEGSNDMPREEFL